MAWFNLKSLFGKKRAVAPDERPKAGKQHSRVSGGKYSLSCSAVSDVGCMRRNNEDNYILGKHMNTDSADRSETTISASRGWFFAGVFDGMGGGEAGELASRFSSEIFLENLACLGRYAGKEDVDWTVRKAFQEANNRIISLQETYEIFGTTGTVFCSNGIEFKIYHLGDSRAYLLRERALVQLTKDQTLAQMKMEIGLYDENDPQAEAEKHKLTEYIGRDWTLENLKPVENYWRPVCPGDYFLLCSDGLYDMCADEEIVQVLENEPSVRQKAVKLADLANCHGGVDNITCVLTVFETDVRRR